MMRTELGRDSGGRGYGRNLSALRAELEVLAQRRRPNRVSEQDHPATLHVRRIQIFRDSPERREARESVKERNDEVQNEQEVARRSSEYLQEKSSR